ncbi:MAG: chromate transporter [Victivallaceae bacterium]|nr:chromate transporter [Victivallaceae bacterium]
MSLWTLYWLFAKFGVLCFGGGYVLVPLIIDELVMADGVDNFAVLTPAMFGNLVAIAQMTPGPIGLNTATFVGYMAGSAHGGIGAGIVGGLVGTCGLLLPGLALVILASYYLDRFKDSLVVEGLLAGLRPASLALIMMAVVIFLGMGIFDGPLPLRGVAGAWLYGLELPSWPHFNWPAAAIALGSVVVLRRWKVNVVWILLAAGALGAFFCR